MLYITAASMFICILKMLIVSYSLLVLVCRLFLVLMLVILIMRRCSGPEALVTFINIINNHNVLLLSIYTRHENYDFFITSIILQ